MSVDVLFLSVCVQNYLNYLLFCACTEYSKTSVIFVVTHSRTHKLTPYM